MPEERTPKLTHPELVAREYATSSTSAAAPATSPDVVIARWTLYHVPDPALATG